MSKDLFLYTCSELIADVLHSKSFSVISGFLESPTPCVMLWQSKHLLQGFLLFPLLILSMLIFMQDGWILFLSSFNISCIVLLFHDIPS